MSPLQRGLPWPVCLLFPGGSEVLPAMRATWVWSLGRENPLEKEMATHSSTLALKIPWTEEPGRLPSIGSQRVKHDWVTSLSLSHTIRAKYTFFSVNVNLPGKEHVTVHNKSLNKFKMIVKYKIHSPTTTELEAIKEFWETSKHLETNSNTCHRWNHKYN